MFTRNINIDNKSLRIIVAPLDWGLGHATRCIPIITTLRAKNVEVLVAADGATAALLKAEFPNIEILPLPGYNIQYSGNKRLFTWKLLSQFFTIRKKIGEENVWLENVMATNKIDAIISDNRFGLSSSKIPCVFMTHQLHIITGFGFLDKMAQKINYQYINRFTQCWIPDVEAANGYAGVLSHPKRMPQVPSKYLGNLSRMKPADQQKKFDFLFLLSGPEPQRTQLENKIVSIIKQVPAKLAIVRGLPLASENLQLPGIAVFNHLPANALNELIGASETVICRSGYSTVMDLLSARKKALLIPTPAQQEQEYLAKYLFEKSVFKYVTESKLNKDIFKMQPFDLPIIPESTLESCIADWLRTITKQQ